MTEHERTCMDFWVELGAKAVWRVTPAKEWVQLAIQLSTVEPAVMLAITAYATIQKSVGITMHKAMEPPTARRSDVVIAMRQFSKATSALRKYIDQAIHSQGSLEPVLICSILFLCCELGRGKFQNAMAHMGFARRIIMDGMDFSNGKGQPQRLSALSGEAMHDFGQLFHAIDNESELTGIPIGLDQDDRGLLESVPKSIPPAFASLAEAKEHLNALIAASGDIHKELFQIADEKIAEDDRRYLHPSIVFCITHLISKTIEPSQALQGRIQALIHAYESWTPALDAVSHRQTSQKEEQQFFLAITTLRLQHFVAINNLRRCSTPCEMAWDEANVSSIYAPTLDLAERFLTATPTNMLHGVAGPVPPHLPYAKQESSFSLEPTVLPALALIAFKCRDTRVRRRALDLLLTARRREGAGYSESMAWFISVFVDTEEQAARQMMLQRGVVPPESLTAEQVPEAARLSVMAIFGETAESTLVVASRFRYEDESQMEVRKWRGQKEPVVFEELRTTVTRYRCP